MNRPVSVVVSTVLLLLASAVTLLFALFMFVLRGEMDREVPSGDVMSLLLAAFFGAGGILGIATAVDLLRLRHWARISLLVFAGIVVAIGAISVLAIYALPWDQMVAETPGPTGNVRPILLVGYAVPIAIGTWWLVLFTRPAMKERFAAGRPAEPSAVPLGIAFIAWVTLIGGVGGLVLPLMKMPAFLVGLVFTGYSATVIFLTLAAAQVYAGWGLLKLHERARRVAIAIYGLGAIHLLLMILVPGVRERAEEASSAVVAASESPVGFDPAGIWWGMMSVALVAVGVALWLLVRWKGAFKPSSTPGTAPPP